MKHTLILCIRQNVISNICHSVPTTSSLLHGYASVHCSSKELIICYLHCISRAFSKLAE